MDAATFNRLMKTVYASDIVWCRLQHTLPGSAEWNRLRRKHGLLRDRYTALYEMSQPHTIN